MEQKKKTILEWYQEKQKFIDAPCGGQGTCGRCKIQFHAEAPTAHDRELALLTKEELEAGIRLACFTELPEGLETMSGLFGVESVFRPVQEAFWLNMQQDNVGQQGKQETSEERQCAILLDIGTTTLAMSLVEIDSGRHLATVTSINHQRIYGADVVSRIKAANEGKLEKMRESILLDMIALLERLLQQTEREATVIKKILIAGNTTMCHILLGYSCKGLAHAPFRPISLTMQKRKSSELFRVIQQQMPSNIAKLDAQVIILPGITTFVGADILAGMYAYDMDKNDEVSLFIDIGTNGEMVIGNEKGFLVTSTAAGPVFEGGNISCGMPAVAGAITHVYLEDKECVRQKDGLVETENGLEKELSYEIFEEKPGIPKGLCGSGLIDLAALLRKKGVIDENGTLQEIYFTSGFPVESSEWKEKSNIILRQSDIRELQLGKAAICAGIEVLESEFRKQNEGQELEQVYLAGGFGSAIHVASAREIGLLPNSLVSKVVSVGNAVLAGLYKFLFDEKGEQRLCDMVEKSRELSLTEHVDFEECFIQAMQFW